MRKIILFTILISISFANNLEEITLQLKWKHQFQFAGFYMAKEMGFYEDVGLDVKFKEYDGNLNIADAMIGQKAQFAIDDSQIIYNVLKNKPLKILMPIFEKSPFAIVASSKNGINTLKDLEGKVIEISSDTTLNIALLAMLRSQNIYFIGKSPTFKIDELLANSTQGLSAYVANEPYAVEKAGFLPVVFSPIDYGFDFYGDILFTSQEYLATNEETVRKFVQASRKGWKYAFKNINHSINVIYEKYNSQQKTKAALKYEAEVLSKHTTSDKNFKNFDTTKIETIAKMYAYVYPDLYNLKNLSNLVWEEDKFNTQEIEYLKGKDSVKVCICKEFDPFNAVKNKKPYGVVGDIFALVSKKTGLNFEAIEVLESDMDKSIEQGICDIGSLSLQNSYYDSKTILTTLPYIDTYLAVITTINEPYIDDEKHFLGQKLLTKHESAKKHLQRLYPWMDIHVQPDTKKALQSLEDGQVKGYVVENISSDRVIQEFSFEKFKISGFLLRDNPMQMSMRVVASKPLLFDILNKSLASISKEQVENIKASWKIAHYTRVSDYTFTYQIIAFFLIILISVVFVLYHTRKNNRKLNQLLESTIEGIAIFKDGKIIEFNKQILPMFGLESERDILSKKAYEFVDKNSHERLKEKLQEDQEPYELMMKKKDGTLFPALIKGRNLENGIRITCVVDISEVKKMQSELEKLNSTLEKRVEEELCKNEQQHLMLLHQSRLAQMGEMIGMIAHQWRQPLNVLSLMVQNISLQNEKHIDSKTKIDNLTKESMKVILGMSKTIDDFRNFFNPRKMKKKYRLDESILGMLDLLQASYQDHKIEIETQIIDKITLVGYENEIGQAIINLLHNAKDALVERKIEQRKITVRLELQNDSAFLTICDNAGGISESILPKIFDPYFSTKEAKNGTGIGLYMTKIIIEEHAFGKIKVRNNDEGAVFEILLPIKESV